MFDKKVPAEAAILSDLGPGDVTDTDIHGVDWEHHKYIVEVRPSGESPFRVETKAKVPIFSAPQPGDVVKVLYEPRDRKAEIQIEGDPRYDPKLIREREKQQKAAAEQALLSGAPVPVAARQFVPVVDPEHEPKWLVPDKCPECGARVDQSTASMAEHPKCEFCSQPLPVQPLR